MLVKESVGDGDERRRGEEQTERGCTGAARAWSRRRKRGAGEARARRGYARAAAVRRRRGGACGAAAASGRVAAERGCGRRFARKKKHSVKLTRGARGRVK